MPKILNVHHFSGGVDALPSTAVYVGRPSPDGNPYSSKSGLYTHEECVALHRVDLYDKLVTQPNYLQEIKDRLGNKDLACWCVNDKHIISCHADNYLHILSPEVRDRAYDKSTFWYLMDDARRSLETLKEYVRKEVEDDHYIDLYLAVYEVITEINYFLVVAKERKMSVRQVCEIIGLIVIELDLIVRESDEKMIDYRWDHLMWTIERYVMEYATRSLEPVSPRVTIKRKLKKSSSSQ